MDEAPNEKTGVPTVAIVVTVCVAVCGPLHPAALAVIVLVPLQPEAQVTVPVDELIELPGNALVVTSNE